MNKPAGELEVIREFGLSHSDFYRVFPRLEPTATKVKERYFELERADGRKLEIQISPEKIRKLATLRIPYMDITFRFLGWSDAQRTEFFTDFDRSFQKGGG